ncbi:three-helix bundle dimerization domain-containing protein [Streptomyces sp. URMC 125]|uniref:three-helix bundle dimerization domain-containing protein n=1 Tax=Streptomyces sp. URMC 125 TaxID=3423419 RepID=UPI003F1C31B7
MDSEHSLDRVIEHLTARFPHHGEQAVAETVYATHARLRRNATVTTHLAALTQRQAGDALARTLSQRKATT